METPRPRDWGAVATYFVLLVAELGSTLQEGSAFIAEAKEKTE